MKKLGFIGMGNMASAIASGIVKSGFLNGEEIIAFDIAKAQLDKMQAYNISFGTDVKDVVTQSDIVLLAVKPQVIEKVIEPIKDILKNKTIISIVLGYDYEKFDTLVDASTRHVFVMPNTPAQVLQGMSLIEEKNSLNSEELNWIKKLFASIGEVEIIPSHLMGVGGALSGCGPAYLYMIIEALSDGAVKEGMPRQLAYKLASQTVMGAGAMQLQTGIHPGVLKDNVCSPGGSTIRGVQALENGNLRATIIDAISASLHYQK
ncbi:MAG: pyrroline-5-carboxylate reductase [Coprobacillus sp.]